MSDAEKLHTELEDLAKKLDYANDALGKATQTHAKESQVFAQLEGTLGMGSTLFQAFETQLSDQEAALKRANAVLRAATKSAKDARDAFEKAADKQSLSNDNVRPLYDALKAASVDRDNASDEAAAAEAAVKLTVEQLEQLRARVEQQSQERDAQSHKTEAARTDRLEKEAQVAEILKEMAAKRDEMGKALAAAGGGGQQPPQRPLGGLVDLYRKQGEATIKDFLTIKTRRIDYDDWADDAFAALERWAADQTTHEVVRKSTLDAGVGSDIDAVTRKLNRRRISDVRREILARTYPVLLRNRLEDEQQQQPGDQPFVVKVQVAEDHTGLADTIALDLDAKTAGSPRDVFSDLMTTIAVKNLNLNAPAGSPEYEILKAKICAST
ncbi:MAG: hypothetical protein AAGL89_09555 [Pseudomonadota bacterium]